MKLECDKLLSIFACKFNLRRYTKGTTVYAVAHAAVRRVLALEVGDANATTNVMIAIDPAHALVAGKQKMACLVLQARKADKAMGVVKRREAGVEPRLDAAAPGLDAAVNGVGGAAGGAAAVLIAMMELATGVKAGGVFRTSTPPTFNPPLLPRASV